MNIYIVASRIKIQQTETFFKYIRVVSASAGKYHRQLYQLAGPNSLESSAATPQIRLGNGFTGFVQFIITTISRPTGQIPFFLATRNTEYGDRQAWQVDIVTVRN
jgi:hypothetical protein